MVGDSPFVFDNVDRPLILDSGEISRLPLKYYSHEHNTPGEKQNKAKNQLR